jgi:hypothetical protein
VIIHLALDTITNQLLISLFVALRHCKKNSGHSLVGLRTLPAMTRLSPNDLFMSLLKPHDQTATVLFKPLRANTSTTICYDYHQAMNLLLDTRPYRHHYGQIDWFNQIINNKVIAREFI